MAPLVGSKEQGGSSDEGNAALRAEVDRLNSLTLAALAAEVMAKGFGAGGPGADDDAITLGGPNVNAGPSISDISRCFRPAGEKLDLRALAIGFEYAKLSADERLCRQLDRLAAEGLQELEHGSLVRVQMHTAMGMLDWAATRRGRAALEAGNVASVLGATG